MRSFTFGSQSELGGKIKWNNLRQFFIFDLHRRRRRIRKELPPLFGSMVMFCVFVLNLCILRRLPFYKFWFNYWKNRFRVPMIACNLIFTMGANHDPCVCFEHVFSSEQKITYFCVCQQDFNLNCQWGSVWPDKNRQMSIKVAQKWFH